MIIVTGASSSPGWGIVVELLKAGFNALGVYNEHSVKDIVAVKLDLMRDPEAPIRDYKPEILVHVASIGNVDMCEERREFCYKFNVEVSRRLIREAYRVGSKIIYLSTDYVFQGDKGMYKEEDTPKPINFYGLTKLLAEEAVLTLGGSIVRTSAVFGPGPGRPNFAKIVYEKLSAEQSIEAATDQYLSPTFNLILGRAIVRLLKREFTIIHVAGPRLNRYEYAVKVAETFKLDKNLIKPTTMDKIPYKAPRPRDSSLDNSKALKETGLKLNDIDAHLKEYMEHLEKKVA